MMMMMMMMMMMTLSRNAVCVWHRSCLARLACSGRHGREHKQECKSQESQRCSGGKVCSCSLSGEHIGRSSLLSLVTTATSAAAVQIRATDRLVPIAKIGINLSGLTRHTSRHLIVGMLAANTESHTGSCVYLILGGDKVSMNE